MNYILRTKICNTSRELQIDNNIEGTVLKQAKFKSFKLNPKIDSNYENLKKLL